MQHVALVIPTLDWMAGAERQVVLLARGLAERGWRISVVALAGTGGTAGRELDQAGIAFLSLEMRKGLADPRGWMRFHRWLRSQSPDVLHAHLPHASWLARWSRLLAPAPLVVDSIHTSSTGTMGRCLGYRCSNWLTNRVSAVSQGVADAYRSARMVSPGQLTIIPNGVDVHRWRPDPSTRSGFRRQLGIATGFLWFTAGRLDPVKDYPALLWAMMNLPLPARLVIAGAGPVEGHLRRLTLEFGLESRVRFLGFEPDVLPWMQAADAFVLSSRWEGLPMSLLEAGACGLPAVATDVSGTREIIVPGENGFLAARENAPALQREMAHMMRLSAEDRTAMGDRARQRVVEAFSLDAVLTRWEALYRELLAHHARPARWRRKP